MQIANNKVVTVTYRLQANLPAEEKRHIETADASQPLKFLYGVGMMIPGFERGLEGKGVGDAFAKARAGTCDDGDLAGKPHGVSSWCCVVCVVCYIVLCVRYVSVNVSVFSNGEVKFERGRVLF